MTSAVVCRREHREQAASCKSLKPIHHTLVSPQNEVDLIVLKECLYTIWPKFHNVSSTVRVSDKVRLDTELTITVSRVTPQNVDDKLLLDRRYLMDYFQGSLNLFNLLQTNKSTSYTTM